jgi:hypothetical protein
MGLDIYLRDRSPEVEARRDELEEAKYGWNDDANKRELTPEEEAEYEALDKRREEKKSEKYPDHFFNRNYLRSSYNDSGINRVLKNLGHGDLYELFDYKDSDNYHWYPSKEHLEGVKARVAEVIEALKAETLSLGVSTESAVSPFKEGPIGVSPEEAVALAHDKLVNYKGHFTGGFSSGDGTFFPKGFEIMAAIPGVDVFGKPAVHLVYKRDMTFYIQALEITIEFIEEALSMEHPQISWSS